MEHFNVQTLTTAHDFEKLRLNAQNRNHWSKGVDAITNAYKQYWIKQENKKPRYTPEPAQAARGGGGRRGRARGGREGTTGRRGRGRPPIQAQPLRGQ